MKVNIKYFEGAKPLVVIEKGNWIDVYANKTVFIPQGENAMIPLGFAMQLPEGYEGHLAPRSSTYKKWGIILANHVGIIDTSYCGDNDEWLFNAICVNPTMEQDFTAEVGGQIYHRTIPGTIIHKGDKIGQFRLMPVQEPVEFNPVESLGNPDRGGFGTTGAN